MNRNRIGICVLLLTIANSAAGQTVHYVKVFDTQALLYSKQGAIHGCGIRFIGVAESMDQSVDASVNLTKQGNQYFGLVKFGAYRIDTAGGEPRMSPVAIRNGWIKVQNGDATTPLSEPMKGEDERSVLYAIKAGEAANLLLAVATTQDFLIAVTPEGSAFERVYSGPLQLADRDGEQLRNCITTLQR